VRGRDYAAAILHEALEAAAERANDSVPAVAES